MKRNSLKKKAIIFGISSLALLLFSCKKDHDYSHSNPPPADDAKVLTASGDSAAVIETIKQFRHLLGDSLNTVPNKTSGRREVNWDGVPPAFTNANNFPVDFFNSIITGDPAGRKRGLVYNTGTTLRVDSTAFSEVDASYAGQFHPFSRKRLITNMTDNITAFSFKVPGTSTDAFVKGFGIIFSDVDTDNSTYVEFFSGSTSLGIYKAPSHPANGNFSFLGVAFNAAKVTNIKITGGNGFLTTGVKDISDGGTKDLVVMDDFFYSEPIALQ